MIDCTFHETKRERKFYEDKKQKALMYLDHTIGLLYSKSYTKRQLVAKLSILKNMVADI